MKLSEIAKILNAKILTCEDKADEIDIRIVGASDMMSDVLLIAKPGMLLITGLNSPQVIRTANIVGIPAVVVVRKNVIPSETIEAAKNFGIALLHSPIPMYVACGKLYEKKLKDVAGIIE
ncbi:MAG: hypothetical protein J7K69_05760 [Thermotogae bacterium]|nr:hypothetical protein [Thermotogota bacterium]